jgi:hypothetical protein
MLASCWQAVSKAPGHSPAEASRAAGGMARSLISKGHKVSEFNECLNLLKCRHQLIGLAFFEIGKASVVKAWISVAGEAPYENTLAKGGLP